MKNLINQSIQYELWYKSPSTFFKDITGFTPSEGQKQLLDDLTDPTNNRILINAFSGGGKTLVDAVIALWHSVPQSIIEGKSREVKIISGGMNQARLAYDYVRKFIRHPSIYPLLKGDPTQVKTQFQMGSSVGIVAASETAFYGIHPDILICDEASIIEDNMLRDSYSRVAPSTNARLVWSGTPYYQISEFVDVWDRKDKYPQWRRYHWDVYNASWISKESIEEAKANLPEHEFNIKWMANPTALIGTLFNGDDIRASRIEYRPKREEIGGEVSMGIDWGMTGHPTAIEIVQYSEPNIVHLEEEVRVKLTSEKLQELILRLVDVHKVNYVYTDDSSKWENQRLEASLRPKGIRFKPIAFRGEKGNLMSYLNSLLEQKKIRIWEGQVELLRELSNYTLETKRNDDRVDATALACYPFVKYSRKVGTGRGYLTGVI